MGTIVWVGYISGGGCGGGTAKNDSVGAIADNGVSSNYKRNIDYDNKRGNMANMREPFVYLIKEMFGKFTKSKK